MTTCVQALSTAATSNAVADYSLSWRARSAEQCSNMSLATNQIHLWIVRLGRFMVQENTLSDSLLPSFSSLLTPAELRRGQRIVDNDYRKYYFGGRIGLRILLSGYSGLVNSNLEFGYGSRGKPKLLNQIANGRLAFNYTLSKGYALYAFAWNRPLGVDLEVFPRPTSTARLARRILTKCERAAWNMLHKEQQDQAMLACWTRKEAYGKTLGVGIRYTMNQVNLFANLHCPEWRIEETGLFDDETTRRQQLLKQLKGVQLRLPIAGVASLMYAVTRAEHETEHNAMNNPALLAFQLQ